MKAALPTLRIGSLISAITLFAGNAFAETKSAGFIVESHGSVPAATVVRRVGGRVTHDLPIVNGVSAQLTDRQVIILRKNVHVELFADVPVATQSSTDSGSASVALDIYQRSMLGVNTLAAQGIDGTGVTVAVLDSGILQYGNGVLYNASGGYRVSAQYDATTNILNDAAHPCKNWPCANDTYGHGSHIAGLIANSTTVDAEMLGQPEGIAPMVNLINVKAFDGTGTGSYATVLNGLNWILKNQNTYGSIRVVNMSFGAKPQSFYWNDPIDQAVMKLWQAGVVVVASAGNFGPKAQTIAVPGNTPYVITVGAMTDNFTPNDPTDDGVTSFSSTGPTYEGFVKPDVVAPGGHLAALMKQGDQYLATSYPQFASVESNLFVMSGTSQSAAVTTGVVALMLQANPKLTPDQVKCRLLATADAAIGKGGKAAYTIFQQGAGRVNAYAAVYSQAANCANQGLTIAADIAGTEHFGGPARQNRTTGAFYVVDSEGNTRNNDGYLWNQSFAKTQGYLWNAGYLWNNGYLWNAGYLWSAGYLWNNGYLWNQSSIAPASSPAAMESWNNQE